MLGMTGACCVINMDPTFSLPPSGFWGEQKYWKGAKREVDLEKEMQWDMIKQRVAAWMAKAWKKQYRTRQYLETIKPDVILRSQPEFL